LSVAVAGDDFLTELLLVPCSRLGRSLRSKMANSSCSVSHPSMIHP
jgi:hypothetical protein